MICEKCKANMTQVIENSVQGWVCPICGWGVLTTYIRKNYADITEYSIYIKAVDEIDKEKIKLISKIAGVNYLIAREMLLKDNVCILKDRAPEVKAVIDRLEKSDIQFIITPEFNY